MLQAVLDCVYTVAVLPQTCCLLPLCPTPTICFRAFLFLEPEEFYRTYGFSTMLWRHLSGPE